MKKVLSFILAFVLMVSCMSMITFAEGEITGTITGATLNIGSSLTLDYYATFTNAAAEDVTMRFTSSSERVTNVKGVYDSTQKMYKFSYTGINPQCMSDNIKAELIYNGETIATKEEYSVKAYCESMALKSASELKYTTAQTEALRTLLADMLTYGAESQKYREYNTSDLADTAIWITAYKTAYKAPLSVKTVDGNLDANNKVKSVGLNMANVNKIYFKLIITDDVTVKLNGKTVNVGKLKEDGNTRVLYTDGIKATQFDDVYTLTIEKGGSVISTVKYNVNAYIVSKSSDATVGAIVKALNNYGTSAEKYVQIIEATTSGGDFDLGEEDDLLAENGENLIPAKASTFEGASSYTDAGWTKQSSPIISLKEDDFGTCLHFNPNGVAYNSVMLNIAPYITEPGVYTITLDYKVVGATQDKAAFSGIIRTSAENSFATVNNGLYYRNLGNYFVSENNIWNEYSASFVVTSEDIDGQVGVPWNFGFHSIQTTITDIYIDNVVLIKRIDQNNNLISQKASNFDKATSYNDTGWTKMGSPTLSLENDEFGTCLHFNPNGVTYNSPLLDIAPYITEPGEYTVTLNYKVVGATQDKGPFSGIIRTSAENSFATVNNGLYYCNLGAGGACANNIWKEYSASFVVTAEDIEGQVGVPWNFGFHSIQTTITDIYIDNVTLVKTEQELVTEAETWVAEEITLVSDKKYDDSFYDVDVDLILTNGTTTYTVPAFWDGGDVWRVRFMCPEEGVWTYTTKCTDTTNAGLHNITGALVCTEYSGDLEIYKRGFVTTSYNKKYFTYADGTPFFYLGDTHWGLGTETQYMVETIADLRAEQGYTVYQSQPIGAGFNLRNGLTSADISGFKNYDKKFQYIASVGLVHANSQFIFPSAMSELIANNGGYTDELLASAQKYKTDENGNNVKITAEQYALSDEVKTYLEKLSRYWVARYSAYPVMWTMGQEVDKDFFWTQTVDCHGHYDWGYANNPYHKIAEYMAKYDPYNQPLSAHQEGSSYSNAQNSTFRNIEGHTWWAAQWKPSLTTEDLHTIAKTYAEYGQGKPCINYEPYYVWLQTKNFGGRAQAWMSFLSGFAGHAYGAQDTWAYTNSYLENETKMYDGVDTNTAEEKQAAVWQDAMEYPASFQMIYMKDFLTGTVGQWYDLIPRYDDTAYLERDTGALAAIASTSDHRKIVMYFFNFDNTTNITVGEKPNAKGYSTATGTLKKLSANTTYNYMWFNPVTGQKTYGSFTSTASGTWDIPNKVHQDMVLYVYNR